MGAGIPDCATALAVASIKLKVRQRAEKVMGKRIMTGIWNT
jgi:hypothetical protein